MKSVTKLLYRIIKTSLGGFNPFELNFAITYLCNSRCKTCNIWKTRSTNEMKLDEIEKFAKKIKFIHWLRITGGEPFLRKDYVDVVKILNKELDLYLLTTPTNALLPDIIEKKVKAVLEFLKSKYVITVSLDGPKEVHDYIRGIGGAWEKSIATFKKLKNLERRYRNFKVLFGYTISPFNVGYFHKTLEEVKKVLPNVSYNDFHINIFQFSEAYYRINQKDISIMNIREFSRRARVEIKRIIAHQKINDLISLINRKYLLLGIKYLRNLKTPIRCNVYNLSVFVDPYGNVYPCTIFDIKLGNLRKTNYNLLKILNSDKARRVVELIKKSKCPGCWTPCEAHQMIISRLLR